MSVLELKSRREMLSKTKGAKINEGRLDRECEGALGKVDLSRRGKEPKKLRDWIP